MLGELVRNRKTHYLNYMNQNHSQYINFFIERDVYVNVDKNLIRKDFTRIL